MISRRFTKSISVYDARMQLGVVGLSTMGSNLARNAARNGAKVAVFNRTTEKMEEFIKNHGKEGDIVGCKTPEELCKALTAPRAIHIMVKAGKPVDDVIEEFIPFMQKGDIFIDGGNSHYVDSERREKELAAKGFQFLGMGVSGGEEGALHGPSMMPGGSKEAFDHLQPLLEKMAAKDGAKGTCVAYVGPGGSGHFVKMVHNGIEYGIMQLIAECYDVLKRVGGKSNDEIADIVGAWNKSEILTSFLLEITEKVLRKKEGKESLVDLIKDMAAQKGTGKWTTEAAFEFGVAVPTITAAVDARIVSSGKDFRMMESARWTLETVPFDVKDLSFALETALELSIANTYGQGFVLMIEASKAKQWNLNASEIARIWRGGCIIRSGFLPLFQKAFTGDKETSQGMVKRFAGDAQKKWRSVVALGAFHAIPLPAMSASLSYFDAYRTDRLPQNLIQAQRDFFGAHTYERLDKPGTFHTDWES
jgi:6-phosphogluconate dehydrogenase